MIKLGAAAYRLPSFLTRWRAAGDPPPSPPKLTHTHTTTYTNPNTNPNTYVSACSTTSSRALCTSWRPAQSRRRAAWRSSTRSRPAATRCCSRLDRVVCVVRLQLFKGGTCALVVARLLCPSYFVAAAAAQTRAFTFAVKKFDARGILL